MFVEHGNGATTGMTPEQHFAFARGRQEDVVILSTEDLEGIRESVAFEAELGTEEVDAFRRGVAQRWLSQAAALNSAQLAWLRGADGRSEPFLKRIHTPFAEQLAKDTAFPQAATFLRQLGSEGFLLVGPLPRCEGAARRVPPQAARHTDTAGLIGGKSTCGE